MKKIILSIILLFLIFSCTNEKMSKNEQENKIEPNKNDSITISIKMPAKYKTIISMWGKPYDQFDLRFINNSDKDSTITKKIPKIYDKLVIPHFFYFSDENNNFRHVSNFFIVDKNNTNLKLVFKPEELKYIDERVEHIDTDKMFKSYRALGVKFLKNKKKYKTELLSELDTLYTFFKNKVKKNKTNTHVNELFYLKQLQEISPNNQLIENYLKNTNEIFTGGPIHSILFHYIKYNIETLNFKELTIDKYSSTHIELLAIGIYRFLRLIENKGNPKFQKAKNWLKETEFYKRDSINIKKQITPIDNVKFKEYLSKLSLFDSKGNKTKVQYIIKQNKAKYYLIDFWATWCAPCISGIKTMDKMKIPKNVKVISLSVDKERDKEKWSIKAKELKLKHSYWYNEKLLENKGFTRFIEMQTIPRYILIDKDLNLIDPAFYHPHESQFLTKLKDVKNHKYW